MKRATAEPRFPAVLFVRVTVAQREALGAWARENSRRRGSPCGVADIVRETLTTALREREARADGARQGARRGG